MNNEELVKEILIDDESMSEAIARLASDNHDSNVWMGVSECEPQIHTRDRRATHRWG